MYSKKILERFEMGKNLNVNLVTYSDEPPVIRKTYLSFIDMDKEREKDIASGNGFIIQSDTKSFDKLLRDPDGIFSPRFGQTLVDLDPFMHRYKCGCTLTQGKVFNNTICPHCGTKVVRVDDNYEYFGWIKLDNYKIIHPGLYDLIASFIGVTELETILKLQDDKDENGHSKTIARTNSTKYHGIGMLEFQRKFDEIMDFYLSKKKKEDHYNQIMKNRDKVFTHSIPVFTTYLRPYDINEEDFPYESTNEKYRIITTHMCLLNNSELMMNSHMKSIEESLFKIQSHYMKLCDSITQILSTKKGIFRQLFGGKYAHSARSVIVQNSDLEVDQITLPYYTLVELLQHTIINILKSSYGMTYFDAWSKLSRATRQPDQMIIDIIYQLIKANGRGIPVIINRNPTIGRGGILQMFCIGMTMTYTMALPLQILGLLGADFDGDTLNIMLIINQDFFERAYHHLNPRNCMYISNNDGKTNKILIPNKDCIICWNSLIRLSRDKYTKEEIEYLKSLKE